MMAKSTRMKDLDMMIDTMMIMMDQKEERMMAVLDQRDEKVKNARAVIAQHHIIN